MRVQLESADRLNPGNMSYYLGTVPPHDSRPRRICVSSPQVLDCFCPGLSPVDQSRPTAGRSGKRKNKPID